VILLVVSTSSAAAAALRRPERAALRFTARTRSRARCSQSSPASIGAANPRRRRRKRQFLKKKAEKTIFYQTFLFLQ